MRSILLNQELAVAVHHGVRTLAWLGWAACLVVPAWGGQAQVAVAANFAEPIKAVAAVLEKTTGHTLQVSLGHRQAVCADQKRRAV